MSSALCLQYHNKNLWAVKSDTNLHVGSRPRKVNLNDIQVHVMNHLNWPYVTLKNSTHIIIIGEICLIAYYKMAGMLFMKSYFGHIFATTTYEKLHLYLQIALHVNRKR